MGEYSKMIWRRDHSLMKGPQSEGVMGESIYIFKRGSQVKFKRGTWIIHLHATFELNSRAIIWQFVHLGLNSGIRRFCIFKGGVLQLDAGRDAQPWKSHQQHIFSFLKKSQFPRHGVGVSCTWPTPPTSKPAKKKGEKEGKNLEPKGGIWPPPPPPQHTHLGKIT